MRIRNIFFLVVIISGILVGANPSEGYDEAPQLNEKDFLSLNESNYKEIINSSKKCVVLYYRDHYPLTFQMNYLMIRLKKILPKDVKFYKISLRKFSDKGLKYLIDNDIEFDVTPSIVPYSNGKCLKKPMIRGVFTPEQHGNAEIDKMIKLFVDAFKTN